MESQEKISSEVQENEFEQVHETAQDSAEKATKDWFEIVKSVVLGFFFALAEGAMSALILMGIGYLLISGFNRWLSTDGFIEVGEHGYYYDPENDCFIKPMPNRQVLKGCYSFKCEDGDTIGIVKTHKGKYRYVNVNNLTFINDQFYDCAGLFENGVAMAMANDTIYHISTDGKALSSEPSTWIYASISEINFFTYNIDSDDDDFREIKPTGIFMYEDVNGNYGLMSSDFVRLTPALYSSIEAKSKEVFFCEYFDSGIGCLIDKDGNHIK